jgi:hypothetical protein
MKKKRLSSTSEFPQSGNADEDETPFFDFFIFEMFFQRKFNAGMHLILIFKFPFTLGTLP